MKRLPLIVSFLLFIALCASIAYWALQLFKPPLRPVAAPPRVARADVAPDAAAVLFGGRPGKVAVASNYQLKGIIMSGAAGDSVAILSADGKPAQAIRVGMEVTPSVNVKEVHREYVLLSEGGVIRRVDLPESAKMQVNIASAAPVANQRPVMPGSPPARTQPSPPPAQTGQTPAAPAQSVNAHSSLFPPAASQSQQAQTSQAQTPPAPPAIPPAVVVSPAPAVQQAAPSAGAAASSANAPATMAYPPGTATAPAGRPGELLPPSSLQSR
ncbi:MAG TPA: type II secretion system protein N [Noviherbaspirillum sp.]